MAVSPGHGWEDLLIDLLTFLCHFLYYLAPIELEVRSLEDPIIDQLNSLLSAANHKAPINRPIFLTFLLLLFFFFILEFLFYLDWVTLTRCLPFEDGLIGHVLLIEDLLLKLVQAGVILELQPDSIWILTIDHCGHEFSDADEPCDWILYLRYLTQDGVYCRSWGAVQVFVTELPHELYQNGKQCRVDVQVDRLRTHFRLLLHLRRGNFWNGQGVTLTV